MPAVSVTLLGTAQDGGVPQAGCACPRCVSVHEGRSPELYPVSIGIIDEDERYHLVEASRTISRQLRVWAKSHPRTKLEVISPIESVTLTHLHLGHIDGLGQFGREAMGRNSVHLYASEPVLSELAIRSSLGPFTPHTIVSVDPNHDNDNGNGNDNDNDNDNNHDNNDNNHDNNDKNHDNNDNDNDNDTSSSEKRQSTTEKKTTIPLGKGVTLEFHRVPHRDHEVGQTHAILIRGPTRSLLFLPDHDTWTETLALHRAPSVREWLARLDVDIALLDGTFFDSREIGGLERRGVDAVEAGIPHPPISETLRLLGGRRGEVDPEVCFVHLNHTNPVIGGGIEREEVERLGWQVGVQGQVWEL